MLFRFLYKKIVGFFYKNLIFRQDKNKRGIHFLQEYPWLGPGEQYRVRSLFVINAVSQLL